MGVIAAKIVGFGLAYYAKQNGWCYKRLMGFKVAEICAPIGLEVFAATLIMS